MLRAFASCSTRRLGLSASCAPHPLLLPPLPHAPRSLFNHGLTPPASLNLRTMSGQSSYAAGRSQSVAIAGASGAVGQHVVEELLKAGFQVTALLRKENPTFVEHMSPLGALSVEVIDLSSEEAIRTRLLKHSVDTVICTYSLAPADWHAQITLLDAAEAAGVRRFAPTSFSFPCDRAWKNGYNRAEIETEKRLKTTEMQWTNFACGIFMNYFGAGSPDPGAMGHFAPDERYIVDVAAGTAELPGTGDDPVTFTELGDVARGVAHACLSDADWRRETGYMVGERLSYNEALRIVEEVSGRKLAAKYVPVPELEARIARADDEMARLLDEVLLRITQGLFVFDDSLGALHAGEPPRVWKGKTLRECAQTWWGSPAA